MQLCPVHEQLCGERANPFRGPDVDEDEASFIQQIRSIRTKLPMHEGPYSIDDTYRGGPGHTVRQLDLDVRHLFSCLAQSEALTRFCTTQIVLASLLHKASP